MDSLIFYFIILVLLIIASAFFASAETAITGVSQALIHRLKLEGNQRANIVSRLRKDKEKLISTLLLGNTTCNTFASVLAAKVAENLISDQYAWVVGLVMAFLIFVFAEVLPKSYAFENAEKFSLKIAPILYFLVRLLNPFISAIQIMVNYSLKKFGFFDSNSKTFSATDAIRGAIELHHHEGFVVKNDKDMLGGILDMKETEISQVMIHRSSIISINADLDNEEIIKQAVNGQHTRIPIWQENPDNIIGILNVKDLFRALNSCNNNTKDIDIKKLMNKPWFVPENTTLSEQLSEFKIRRNHFALVIDEYGDLLGLITLENIIEEIVGKIEDEHDLIKDDILKIDDNSYIINGVTSVRDFNRTLDWNLPTDNSITIAGLIMNETGKVPDIGEVFELYSIKFTIKNKHYNQIKTVIAELIKS